MKKRIIFENIESSEYELEQEKFYDEQCNLDKKLNGRIICIADLGLWDGRKSGYKILGHNLNEIMTAGNYDFISIFSDGHNIRKTSMHHDGRNRYLFREIRENRNINNLTEKIYNGEEITNSMLNYYTKSINPYVNEIYGW